MDAPCFPTFKSIFSNYWKGWPFAVQNMLSTGLFPPLKWLIIEVKALHWASAGMTEGWDYRSSCSPAGALIHRAPAHPRTVPGISWGNSQSSPPLPHSQYTCTNPCTTNLQFSFLNSELPEGDLRCQGHPRSSQQHTGWAEHKLPRNRQREIYFWDWKDLKHHFFRNLRFQILHQHGFQSCSPPAEDQHRLGPNEKHLSLLRLNILQPMWARGTEKLYLERVICVQTWARLFSLILLQWWHRWGVLVGRESLVLCHRAAQLLCFYPKTSILVFLKAFSDDMCTWHLFAMYICH